MITKRAMGLLTLATLLAVLAGAGGAQAIPTKFLFSSRVGWKVDKTTGGSICTLASKDECREFAEESGEPDGFSFPESVAVAPDGNVYVADQANHRIQELTKTGEFVLMFGWDVNKTKVEQVGATQKEKNLCTAASGNVCQEGETGTGLPGQLFDGQDLAIDPLTGNVYVLNRLYHRVDEFTESGEFVLMVGGDVNKKGENVCTEAEESECQAGIEGSGIGEFKTEGGRGNLLAVGGPNDLLYVGDEGRVQEFKSNGEPVDSKLSTVPLSANGKVQTLAVDPSGDVFLVVNGVTGVRKYNASGVLQSEIIDPESANGFKPGERNILAIAVDAYGRLGVIEEPEEAGGPPPHGFLYATNGVKISEFASPSGTLGIGAKGLAFATTEAQPSDRLYVADASVREIETYLPVVFPQVETCPAESVTAMSAVLCGHVNPAGLATKAFFEYGTKIPLESLRSPVLFEGISETFELIAYGLTSLVPNQVYLYDVVAEAEVEGKMALTASPLAEFHTPTTAPALTGEPSASFVGSQSVVLNASVNPEHALTRYHFEYGPCPTLAGCAALRSTTDGQSANYGVLAAVQEARGLAAQTTYSFRLVADNEFEYEGIPEGGQTTGAEGHFTTPAAASPSAQTGGNSDVTSTNAMVFGTIDPDGQPATYAFEVGVYNGAATQWGVAFSGEAGDGTVPIEESLALTGLQPGTTYAYRISVSSGYILSESHTLYGALATFTTAGLPSVLASPASLGMLPVPPIPFPKEPAKTTPKKLTKAQRLARALQACNKKGRKQRASCKRSARKKFGAKRPKKKK